MTSPTAGGPGIPASPTPGPARPPWLTSTASCKSCDAPVVWANTTDGRLCLDADPVDVNHGAGTHLLSDRGPGRAPWAERVTNRSALFGRKILWRRHLDTCPYRHRHRGGRTAPADMTIRTDGEYQVLRRWARGASVDAIRIATSSTPDYVNGVLGRVCRFDRDRARHLVAAWEESRGT